MNAIATPPAAELLTARKSRSFSFQQTFIQHVQQCRAMRHAQKVYSATKSQYALKESIRLEKAVDWLLSEIEEKLYLYDLLTCEIHLKRVEDVADVVV